MKRKPSPQTTLKIRLPRATVNTLRALAKVEDRSFTVQVKRIVSRFVRDYFKSVEEK